MDIFILNNIQTLLKSNFLDFIMPIITSLGEIGAVWLLIGLGMCFFKKHRNLGIKTILAVILSTLVCVFVLKPIFDRPRPFTHNPFFDILIGIPRGSSFPSGHTASSFAAAYVIGKIGRRAKIFSYVLASLIAFSRLYLYVHYPSDVIVGIIIGILSGIIVTSIRKPKKALFRKKTK